MVKADEGSARVLARVVRSRLALHLSHAAQKSFVPAYRIGPATVATFPQSCSSEAVRGIAVCLSHVPTLPERFSTRDLWAVEAWDFAGLVTV